MVAASLIAPPRPQWRLLSDHTGIHSRFWLWIARARLTMSGPPPPKCLIGGANFSRRRADEIPHIKWNDLMKKNLLIAGLLLVTLAMPLTAQAQGVPGGAAHGFNEGNRIAGPVGAVVGTAVGGVIGGVEGVLGVDHRYYVSDRPERPVVYRHHWRHRHHRRHM